MHATVLYARQKVCIIAISSSAMSYSFFSVICPSSRYWYCDFLSLVLLQLHTRCKVFMSSITLKCRCLADFVCRSLAHNALLVRMFLQICLATVQHCLSQLHHLHPAIRHSFLDPPVLEHRACANFSMTGTLFSSSLSFFAFRQLLLILTLNRLCSGKSVPFSAHTSVH